jgi:hypothetical protein
MPTKLTRINENDWERLEEIRKQTVMADGQNRTMADAVAAVLDRYDMTVEMIFEMAKDMLKSVMDEAGRVNEPTQEA